jgi:hypothetical protein
MSEEMLPVEPDLTLLRSQLSKNRRRSRRQRCNLASMAKVQIANPVDTRVTWVYNLSLGGVGLNAAQTFEVGQELLINFRTPGKEISPLAAKVVFCLLEADRSWRVGCEFATPITQDILEGLLS